MDRNMAMKVWHWPFLAQPRPLPEMLIAKAPVEYLEWKMASWTKTKDLSPFDPRALDHYRAAFSDPLRIHAHCEDYRAGRHADLANDENDRASGRTIACPLLALWGGVGIANETGGPLEIWRKWAPGATGKAVESGHFLAEPGTRPSNQYRFAHLRLRFAPSPMTGEGRGEGELLFSVPPFRQFDARNQTLMDLIGAVSQSQ